MKSFNKEKIYHIYNKINTFSTFFGFKVNGELAFELLFDFIKIPLKTLSPECSLIPSSPTKTLEKKLLIFSRKNFENIT